MHFRQDIYGYDQQQSQAYRQRLAKLQQRSARLLDLLAPGASVAGAR
jgi:hypothetical protein